MARLPAVVDSLDAIPEQHRGLYESREGKYHFAGVEGFDPGYTTQRQQLQKRVKELETAVKQYEDLGDPASLAAAKQSLAAAEEKRQRDEGQFDKLLESTKKQIVAEWEKRYNEAATKLTQAEAKVGKILIDREATYAMVTEGGIPEFLMPHVRQHLKIQTDDQGDDRVVVLGTDGAPRVKANGELFTIRDFIAELKQDQLWKLGFTRIPASGSGAPAHQLASSSADVMRRQLDALPPVERIAALRRQGTGR